MLGFFTVLAIILTFSVTLTIIVKKRIEQVIPISVVGIVLIIFIAGLFDNLELGANIVQVLTIAQLIFIPITIIKKDKENKAKELIKNIATPGLLVYILLFVVSIIINKNRIFEDYDEFNHWAVIIKNMFMYNTYGTNPETIVRFNEYPPFTAVFQYLFLAVQKVYREDIIIIAQNILYFSIIIPVTQSIRWDKSIRKILVTVPLIIFLPMIFYSNFYLDILVDGILGIMFAYTIFTAFEKEKDTKFKYLKILAGEIMLCLTKTSGIGLAVMALIIILIKNIINRKNDKQNFKKEIKAMIGVILIVAIFTSIWYVKVSRAEKRWDFNQYVEVDNKDDEEQKQIAQSFAISVFMKEALTEKEFTVFSVILILICVQTYTIRKIKQKDYTYYTWAMLISIPIYLVSLLITYATIFDSMEAHYLTCFDRYTSTILLGYVVFQLFVLSQRECQNYIHAVLLVVTIIIAVMPLENISDKYIYGKNYVLTSNINRDIYTKITRYKDDLNTEHKILYIMGPKANMEYLQSMINYEMMPIKIENSTVGNYKTGEEFERAAKDYTHVFIYRMQAEVKEAIKGAFENQTVQNNTLYEVIFNNDKILLEMVK